MPRRRWRLDRQGANRAGKLQPALDRCLQLGWLARGLESALSWARALRQKGCQHLAGALGHRLSGVQYPHRWAHQDAQLGFGKGVVRAAQDQTVDLSWFDAKLAQLACVLGAQCYYFCSVVEFNGMRQAVAGLTDEFCLALQ